MITPHPDVARGEYSQSDWAVNLANIVFKKEGSPEYIEPVEFYSRTYLTDGLKDLLVQILRRVTNGKGEPVIQLKTSFGGEKTHSLLALYHLFGGRIRADQSSSVAEILEAAKIATLTKVNTAVFVGMWTNPLKTTFRGEITAQLAHASGKPELYEMIRRNEESNAPPGVEDLQKFLDAARPCLILIDYMRTLPTKMFCSMQFVTPLKRKFLRWLMTKIFPICNSAKSTRLSARKCFLSKILKPKKLLPQKKRRARTG